VVAVVVTVVNVVAALVVVVEVVVEAVVVPPPPEAGSPRSALTESRNPELAYAWDISQTMTPPKLEKDLLYAMISARVLPLS
jgi:hypothetical protein